MRSFRLTEEQEEELAALARRKNVSRSEIIKEALIRYMHTENKHNKPYELGAPFFGKHGSNESTRSETYKKRIKEQLREKYSR